MLPTTIGASGPAGLAAVGPVPAAATAPEVPLPWTPPPPAAVPAETELALPAPLPLTLPDPLAVEDLVIRLRLWRGDMAGWRARAQAAGAALRRRTWDDMAADIAAIVEGA